MFEVIRALLRAAARSGTLSEAEHAAMLAIVDEKDPGVKKAAEEAKAAPLSQAEQSELTRLQDRQAASKAAAPAPAEQAAPVTSGATVADPFSGEQASG
jgi:hypothetical protein